MTQGIRAFVNATFTNMLRQRNKLGNTEFRRSVMQAAIEEFGITTASAATHYNYALQTARLETPEKVEGLGREPGTNNGGRKPIYTVNVVKARSREIVAEGLSRAAAQRMIDESAGQGRPKLEIQETEASQAQPVHRAPARSMTVINQHRRSTDVQPGANTRNLPAVRQGRERRVAA